MPPNDQRPPSRFGSVLAFTSIVFLWMFLSIVAATEGTSALDLRGRCLLWVAPVVLFSVLLLWVSDHFGTKPPSHPK